MRHAGFRLPYGVQHAAKSIAATQTKVTSLSRSAVELVDHSLPSWKKAMKKGASLVSIIQRINHEKEQLTQYSKNTTSKY